MTPAESDHLLRLAALSQPFVGFSAAVVTLRGALCGEISDRHLRLVRLYVEGGLLVTALGLLFLSYSRCWCERLQPRPANGIRVAITV